MCGERWEPAAGHSVRHALWSPPHTPCLQETPSAWSWALSGGVQCKGPAPVSRTVWVLRFADSVVEVAACTTVPKGVTFLKLS